MSTVPKRYLSKSRFALALTCPTKLNYHGDTRYIDTSSEDEFLQMLAEGGFQVGELAKMMFPGGIEIEDVDQLIQAEITAQLLQRDGVTLFEGTVISGDFLVRADIIQKSGTTIDLIEVKAKSFDSREGHPGIAWRSANGEAIKKDFLPYLQDVAFQTLVVRSAYPTMTVRPFLMLPDKAATATVNGLNQMFRIERTVDSNGKPHARARAIDGLTADQLGEPLLMKIDVTSFVDEIIESEIDVPGGPIAFRSAADQWATAYRDRKVIPPAIGSQCKKCQFRGDTRPEGMRSGFHECWGADADKPIVDLYHPARNQLSKLLASGRRTLNDIVDDNLPQDDQDGGLTRQARQRLQVFGPDPGEEFFFDAYLWQSIEKEFSWPLNFIDFEGARVAIPVTEGSGPYQQIAFQFSHHTMERDGTVKHANEFICLDPGINPNIAFVRALRKALTDEPAAGGTVFMWHHYERTVLAALRAELAGLRMSRSAPDDLEELLAFLDTLTTKEGPTAMVDLRVIADKVFFHPDTAGSSSVKKVLPAVLKSSDWLRTRYPFGDKNPYELLPPVMADIPQHLIDQPRTADSGADEGSISDGGAAMTAYLRMQFTDVPAADRTAYQRALLRYCELDTLAMVMVVEAWRAWANPT